MRSSQLNQQRILDYIKSEIELKGYPPSVREICQAVGLKSGRKEPSAKRGRIKPVEGSKRLA